MRKFIVMGVLAMSVAFAGSAIASDGAKIFKSKCVACHGVEGAGTAMAPAFKGNEFIKTSAVEVLTDVITNGRPMDKKRHKEFSMTMLPQKGNLSADEISSVITYLKSLAK